MHAFMHAFMHGCMHAVPPDGQRVPSMFQELPMIDSTGSSTKQQMKQTRWFGALLSISKRGSSYGMHHTNSQAMHAGSCIDPESCAIETLLKLLVNIAWRGIVCVIYYIHVTA
mmetsp:Transcript_1308/g.3327  ORF Transcript_1308/g.3327 Transcript_1308/m.3327 type:complete len:113 (+) Transcript_1308:2-340(+)